MGSPKGVWMDMYLLKRMVDSVCQGPFEQSGLRSRLEVERAVQREADAQSEPPIWCLWGQMCSVNQGFWF